MLSWSFLHKVGSHNGKKQRWGPLRCGWRLMHPTPCNNITHGVPTLPSLLRKSLTLSPSNHLSLKLPTLLHSEGFPMPLYLKTSSTPLHQFNPNLHLQQSNLPQSILHQQLSNSFQHKKQLNYQQYQHNKQLK